MVSASQFRGELQFWLPYCRFNSLLMTLLPKEKQNSSSTLHPYTNMGCLEGTPGMRSWVGTDRLGCCGLWGSVLTDRIFPFSSSLPFKYIFKSVPDLSLQSTLINYIIYQDPHSSCKHSCFQRANLDLVLSGERDSIFPFI